MNPAVETAILVFTADESLSIICQLHDESSQKSDVPLAEAGVLVWNCQN